MLCPVYRPKLTGVEKTEWSSLPGKKKKREKQRTNICGIPTIKVEDEDYILKHLEQFLYYILISSINITSEKSCGII